MMKSRYIYILGLMGLLAVSCRKPYTPPAIKGVNHYLVVEGVINTGNDSTLVKLSRTVNISSDSSSIPELNAQIAIQNSQGQSYNLKELGNGSYSSAVLNLDNTLQYRLNITTSDGKNYVSDYVAAKASPPIDSVGFIVKSNGLQIYVNTHDPANNTRYYRWDYKETWQFHAEYYSTYITNGDTILPRPSAQQIYQCWANSISTDIEIGSSAKLVKDVIYQDPITFIIPTSEKIELEYSILIKQYALTSDAYNYFNQLKENTEELGSIFDAQPSQLTGNIHCVTNPSIPVIGYITAGAIQQKRIFIFNTQLPNNWITLYPYNCGQDTALYYNPATKMNDVAHLLVPINSPEIITTPTYFPNSPVISGYLYTDPECGDCTIRGTTTEPSFWK
jgi:hypothetical protein